MKKPGSDPAWQEFYDRYAPVLLSVATRVCRCPQMAEDVLQEAMMVLLRELPDFHYDRAKGLFRNYLLTVIHNRCQHALRRAGSDGRLFEHVSAEALALHVDPAAKSPDQQLEEAWHASLEEAAWQRVRANSRHDARNLEAYEAHVLRGESAGAVAARFGLTPNHVHQLKNKVGPKVQDELRALLLGLGEEVGA